MTLPFFSKRSSLALAALLLASCGGTGGEPAISVEDAWARPTASGATTSAAYFTISNAGGEDRLLSVSAPVGDASIHSTSMDGGIMRMRPLDSLAIPADSTVRLEPGGTHVMLTALSSPLEEGSTVPLELEFERSGERLVNVAVGAAAADGAGM